MTSPIPMTALSWLLMTIVTLIWVGMVSAVWYRASGMRVRDCVPARARDQRSVHR